MSEDSIETVYSRSFVRAQAVPKVEMSEKIRSARKIIDRLFPQLAGMEAELRTITDHKISHNEKMLLVHELLKQATPNLDALIHGRAQRRRVSRGQFVEMGAADWRIYENDMKILLQRIKFREYLYFRMVCMDSLRFAELCFRIEELQAPFDKIEHDRIDATRFFSFPPAVMRAVDWDYWLGLPTITEEEAVALSLGKNPDFVCLAKIQEDRTSDRRPSPFFDQYQLRLRALQRAVASGKFGGPIDFQKLKTWAQESKFDFPSRLTELQPAPSKSVDLVEDMNPKSRKTLRLLLLFMAVNKYGHKIEGNSPAITSMVDRLAEYGISIDRNTVRDVLTSAANDEALAEEVTRLRKHVRGS